MLACLLVKHPCELRADFQRVYGLNLDDMGESYSYLHAGDLAAMLPRDSLIYKAENAELEWDDRDYLLWSIEYRLRVISWQLSGDNNKSHYPKPITTPADIARVREKAESTDFEYINKRLGIRGGD